MEEHLADSLDLDRFALEACLSKYHFSRTFKRFMGVTPMQHVTRRRVEWAKVLLRNADMNISSVAFKVGCCHFSDFTRQFKRITGMTPAAYKKSLASETKSVTSR
jgi:AraC family transcriptional regulator